MDKMKFSDFTSAVVERIRDFLPEPFSNASIELNTVKKNNGLTLTGLTVRTENNISPTIYLEHFFESYQDGEDISEVLERIAELRVSNEVEEKFDTESILDYEKVKDRIVPKLINHEWNRSLLEERVHKLVAGNSLAVTYQILLHQDFGGNATIAITNQIAKTWGMDDIEALHELAVENMKRLTPSTFEPMSKVIASMMDEETAELFASEVPEEEMLWVISNSSRIGGAAAVLDTELMQKVEETFAGSRYCIIPSSIHELLAVKVTEDMDSAMLKDMIMSVNAEQVSLDDRLGECAFYMDEKEGLLPII